MQIRQIFQEYFQRFFTSVGPNPLHDISMELVQQIIPQKIESYEQVYLSRALELDKLAAAMKELKDAKSSVKLKGLIFT